MYNEQEKNTVVKKKHTVGNFIVIMVFLSILIGFISGCQTRPENMQEFQSTATISNENVTVIRLANGNWPPYNGESLVEGGCDSLVIKETFTLAGYEVEFGYFPWARSYSLSATGEWDGTMAWDDTPAHREDHWISAEPTSVQEWVFFYRKADPFTWNTMEDLDGKIIGTTTGYVYSDAFAGLADDSVTFLESTNDEANFKMLVAERIDVFPMEKEVGLYLIQKVLPVEEQATITFDNKALSEFNSHLLLSKAIPENGERIQEFDQAFRMLVNSGRYEEIILQCSQVRD